MKRRGWGRLAHWLGATALASALLLTPASRPAAGPSAAQAQTQPPAQPIAITGAAAPSMAALDPMMTGLMQTYALPGGELAAAYNGQLVFAHGYGIADETAGTQVQPDSLFRMASISKTFTAAAILTLVDRGLLTLDTPAFGLLNFQPPAGATEDPRIPTITVRELLQHTGGWDLDTSGDPMFAASDEKNQHAALSEEGVASGLGVAPPVTCPQTIQYMLGQPLDFDPGTNVDYSNFGYCVLGRVIEAVSGMGYEDYVRQYVMTPAGITRMQFGHTLTADRLPGEVQYYDYPGAPLVKSIFPNVTGPVPSPDGGSWWEDPQAWDSAGGWIGSAVDMLKLSTMLGGRRGAPLIQPATFAEVLARPAPPVSVGTPTYFGLGWVVRPVGDNAYRIWKNGNFPGTEAFLVRNGDGWDFAIVFNSRPKDHDAFESALLDTAVSTMNALPTPTGGDDLFPQFP